MVSMLRGFSCFGLVVLFSMLSIHDIALLIVSGGTILLRYFRYPIVFISLVVLHNLMHIPVLIRCGIFQITPGTYVSRFSTTVVDNVLSGFLWKFIRGFFCYVQGNCGLGSTFGAHSILCQTFDDWRYLLLPQWFLDIDHCPNKTGTLVPF